MSHPIHILFTMDVEPATDAVGHSGPVSDEAGRQAVRDYCAVLEPWGYRATFFVHPEMASADPAFFRDLALEGHSLGLHVHTTKFALDPQPCELGGLSSDEQRRILTLAADQFADALGFRPQLFRPGCFSANDATYEILVELGFAGGGVSIPGRIWSDRFCIWSGAHPYVHFAHETFRQLEGTLPFVEVPLSVDLSGPLEWNPIGFHHYADLRPGGMYSAADEVERDRQVLLESILRRTVLDNPPLKTLVVDVHNDRDFISDNSSAARHLRTVLEQIKPRCHALGLEPIASTYGLVVDQMGAPPK